MVPKPVIAVILLFPVTEIYQKYRETQIASLKDSDQKVSQNVYFTKQTVSNACGTVALIHALANNKDILDINTEKMLPNERAEYLKTDHSMTSAHSASAHEGQT